MLSEIVQFGFRLRVVSVVVSRESSMFSLGKNSKMTSTSSSAFSLTIQKKIKNKNKQ